MNDLAICKKIAEIEGVTLRKDSYLWTRIKHTAIEPSGEKYNPLTDDALCFQLMVKYKVSAEHFYGRWCTRIKIISGHAIADDKTLNIAVLLAIIEAHKEL